MNVHMMKPWSVIGSVFMIIIASATVHAESKKGEQEMTISTGKKVTIEYTLKLDDNAVVDSNVGSEPLSYVHGSKQIIPGLEKELDGMKIGDIKQVKVSPSDGYGEINEKAIIEVAKDHIPEDAMKVGAQLQGQNTSGKVVFATVKEIKENTVVLDHNHPLAGKTLHFDVKILDIQEVSN